MINANVYSEVYEILSYMDKATVMKVPIEILENIRDSRNVKYISSIDSEDIFNKNNVNPKTLEIITCLDVNYWMDNEKKEILKEKYRQKVKKEELEKLEKYDCKKMFEDRNRLVKNTSNTQICKESFVKKIVKKIKNLFIK